MTIPGPDSVPTHFDEIAGKPLALRSLAPKRKRQRIRFVMVYQDISFDRFVDDPTLTISEARLFLHLLRSAPFGECYQLNQSRAADRLGMHATTVNKALKGLIERGVVVKDRQRRDCYSINPQIAYSGETSERKAKIAEYA